MTECVLYWIVSIDQTRPELERARPTLTAIRLNDIKSNFPLILFDFLLCSSRLIGFNKGARIYRQRSARSAAPSWLHRLRVWWSARSSTHTHINKRISTSDRQAPQQPGPGPALMVWTVASVPVTTTCRLQLQSCGVFPCLYIFFVSSSSFRCVHLYNVIARYETNQRLIRSGAQKKCY